MKFAVTYIRLFPSFDIENELQLKTLNYDLVYFIKICSSRQYS